MTAFSQNAGFTKGVSTNNTQSRTLHDIFSDYFLILLYFTENTLVQRFTPHDINPFFVPSPQPDNLNLISHISPQEVRNVIKKLNTYKAPDHDHISSWKLQELLKKGVCRLSQIFDPSFTYLISQRLEK